MRPSRKLHPFDFLLWHSLDVWKYYISYTDPNLLLQGLLKTMHRCPVLHEQPLPTLSILTAGKICRSQQFVCIICHSRGKDLASKKKKSKNCLSSLTEPWSLQGWKSLLCFSQGLEFEMEKVMQGVEDCPHVGLTEKLEHLLHLFSWTLFPRKSLLHWVNLRG